MALGYVVALALVSTGLVGLVVGIVRLRGESRARAAGLRGLLLTGHAAAAGGVRPGPSQPTPRRIVVDPAASSVTQDSFAARAALDRAWEALRRVEREAA